MPSTFTFAPSASVPLPKQRLPKQRRTATILAAAAIPIIIHIARLMRPTSSSLEGLEGLNPPLLPTDETSAPGLWSAEDVIRRSYNQTFGALSTESLCTPSVNGETCISSLLSEAMNISSSQSQPKEEGSTRSFPWWFITMLRDIKKISTVHGSWHNLTMLDPPMDFCTIEKVGTTQWRNVQCALNEGKEPVPNPRTCRLNSTALASRRRKRIYRAVMLRDPLERLLSGYINKCASDILRKYEGHCEPNSVFNDTDMTLMIRKDPKQLFAAYVDGFPLKWNMHFFPQSMYCDVLFRHIADYDFVGHMDINFYRNLQDFSEKFGRGNGMKKAMDDIFYLSHELKNRRGGDNLGKQTMAPAHVKEYYTASSVRRALEYFAVDYVMLGLEVPHWAHAILAEEIEIFRT
ncbi:hypothetical protein ACHAWF_015859 [Thalassiosira exigua]